MSSDRLCIFCFKPESDKTPFCNPNAGRGCSYGLAHEYLEPEIKVSKEKPRDNKLCLKCNLHPKNPLASSNGCTHEYAQ